MNEMRNTFSHTDSTGSTTASPGGSTQMTNFWCCDIFLTSWRTFLRYYKRFDVMTYFWHHDKLYDTMNFVTSRHIFWLHDEFIDIVKKYLTSWQTFWCHYALFDIMMYFWQKVLLTSWQTFHDKMLFDVWCIFNVMTNFWSPAIFLPYFFVIITHFLTSWCIFDFMM